ncbi:hypothetical protein BX600DRAFT_210632 [Xylariales sp. PMI_506]|nr:hypothetical protein BX600DRAFT_210632 [Xylariales sp. PMI_506]
MDTTADSFILEAAAGTDIWRKPPTTDVWNAPISRTSSGLLKKFQLARVTFSGPWVEQYDQAGLLLALRRSSSPAAGAPAEKWIKTGVEYYNAQPQLSTVGCDRWADWSVSPVNGPPSGSVTLEVVREGDQHGKSIWIYQLLLDSETGAVTSKVPLREICWIFADEDEGGGEEWLLDVSPLIARPEKKTTEVLKVDFKEFKVEWLS